MTAIGRRRIRNAGGADTTAVIADPVTVAEQPQAVTQTIVQPPPEVAAVTEVIIQPEPPAPELAAIATEEELRLFGGRPLSSSVTVRDAWFKANPGPEQIFGSLVADLAAWRQATTEDPGPGAVQPPAGEVAGSTTAAQASPEAPGPVNDAAGEACPAAGPSSPAASGPASSTRRAPRKRSKGAGA